MNNIFWTAYSNDERHTVINKIKNVVSNYGDIVDFKFFSDLSITMVIEIKELIVDKLYDELRDNIDIDKFKYLNSTFQKERIIFFNITFNKGTGNLKIEVPSVPG